ncbi:hypothetical protein COS77_02655 [Candidatus Roizmanbacteria bacterium CG06_land_8_20_14_3_00_34_14]|uniref:Uncharacterized protein n=2 Tax=Candidatus Roizmaniibacteriota TaxID=1752723 RepID=A0A2M7AUF3_9BACT|nr:MAG: hypothetical protein COT02_04700 [Candidatus Roizmanbacteria bacterium CG07_land_8_20_14_0_80_34_15]PIU74238.1 MAG: hypothetical protein COS77_02655 [Candidatus Roizmanbacteria bacterium CG06_land_8_20_14_3_00_34_14]
MNPKEAWKQKYSRFKKQALLVLTTAFRSPLIVTMGCGTTVKGIPVHDHQGENIATINLGIIGPSVYVPYNESQHGKMQDWVEEGDIVDIGTLKLKGNKKAIHRHTNPIDGQIGAQEFVAE